MEGLSWGHILFTVVAAAAMPWIAAFLRARGTSFLKIYSFCLGLALPGTYIFLIFPKNAIPPERCWIEIGTHCLPPLWTLWLGLAIGSVGAVLTWLAIKYIH